MSVAAFEPQRLPRLDAVDKVTGRAIYSTDVDVPRMLHGSVLRSLHAHARITGIDTTRAERLPGVMAVITAADTPDVRYGHAYLIDRVVLARDKVRYIGEPIAAVAATSAEIAEHALQLIDVVYVPLPAVFDPLAALAADAPILHDDLATYTAAAKFERRGNLAARILLDQGDVDDGFAQAEEIIEEEYRTAAIHQSYLEPHTSIAAVQTDGRITVWTSTQFPFGVRSDLAQALQLPLRKIRVIPTSVGGAFGGKLWMVVEPLCVLLARKSGRPVRIEMSYEEEFAAGRPRVACSIHIRSGVKRDGTLLAREVHAIYDSGAYAYVNPGTNGASVARGLYRLPNVRVTTDVVYTNKHSIGAMRGPGGAQMVYAVESHMDSIAHKLGIDPLELRLRNAVTDQDFPAVNGVHAPVGFTETLRRVHQASGWDTPPRAAGRGRGIACAQWGSNGGASTASVTIDEDGSVRLLTGSIDLTGSDSVMAQIVAHELGIQPSDVQVQTGDTDTAPWTAPTAGSRMTYSMGSAARLAAIDARRKLFDLASTTLEVAIDDLQVEGGGVAVAGDPSRRQSFGQLVGIALGTVGPIVGAGSVSKLGPAPSFIAAVADVEVDPETGLVKLLQFVVAEDVGRALNPLHLEGQIEGGLVLGLGQGLLEEIQYEDGRVVNPRFGVYQLPRAEDVPPILIDLVEVPSLDGPYGARGAGEPGGMPGAAAIANAVFAATGARQYQLPMTPERVRTSVLDAQARAG